MTQRRDVLYSRSTRQGIACRACARRLPTPPTADILEAHYDVARQAGLRYVYIANYPGHEREDTRCPSCGDIVIGRFGYHVHAWNLDSENRCKACGHRIPITGGFTKTPPEERYVPVLFPPMDMLYVCEGLAG